MVSLRQEREPLHADRPGWLPWLGCLACSRPNDVTVETQFRRDLKSVCEAAPTVKAIFSWMLNNQVDPGLSFAKGDLDQESALAGRDHLFPYAARNMRTASAA
jgi:hypothetical protein